MEERLSGQAVSSEVVLKTVSDGVNAPSLHQVVMQLHASQYSASQAGHDSPIIILHGLFGSYRNWHPIAKALSREQLVYSLDLRNHGQSPHADTMDYPQMAEDVLRFIEHNHFDSVRIIAHSMGGKTAMWLALTHPDIVKKLVVVDIAPVVYEHDFSEVLNAFKSIPLESLQSRQQADEYLSQHLEQRNLRQFLLQNLQVQDGHYRWRLNLEVIEQSINNITGFPDTRSVRPFDKRVLFVSGGQSDYLNSDTKKQARALFPMASFSTIKMAGHWLHSEQPELFQSLIMPYLAND